MQLIRGGSKGGATPLNDFGEDGGCSPVNPAVIVTDEVIAQLFPRDDCCKIPNYVASLPASVLNGLC